MRADTKAELQMLRELVWFAYGVDPTSAETNALDPMLSCYFCHEFLLIRPGGMTFGHRRHPKIDVDITIHHIDENRENNNPSNLADCHSSCHKSYHNKKRAALRKEIIRRHEGQENQEETEKIPASRSLLNE